LGTRRRAKMRSMTLRKLTLESVDYGNLCSIPLIFQYYDDNLQYARIVELNIPNRSTPKYVLERLEATVEELKRIIEEEEKIEEDAEHHPL
jgi:hypothetical protein